MKDEEIKRVTTKIPYGSWKKLRRLVEEKKIKSIQDGILRGIEWLISQR